MVHQGTILNRLASLVESGQVQTTLTECLTPMNAAHLRQAHALVESGKMLGKVVVAGW
jgi:NADPH2:quinone reductase